MKTLSSYALVFRLILILGLTTFHSTISTATPVEHRYELDLDLFEEICPVEDLLVPLPKCVVPFLQKIGEHSKQYKIRMNRRTQTDIGQTIPETIFCCAVNELRNCIIKKIGTSCGKYVEKKAESIVNIIIDSGKYMSEELGSQTTCDTWYYKSASPYCWEHTSQSKIGMPLSVLLFISCCFCCGCCCKICSLCCRSREKPTPVEGINQKRSDPHLDDY